VLPASGRVAGCTGRDGFRLVEAGLRLSDVGVLLRAADVSADEVLSSEFEGSAAIRACVLISGSMGNASVLMLQQAGNLCVMEFSGMSI
jgi:hypothetical protein